MIQIPIYCMSAIIFIILIKWTINNLSSIENTQKVIYLVIGLVVVYIITLIIFNISKKNIQYPNEMVEKQIQKMLLLIFIPMNGLVIMPYIATVFKKIKLNEIEENELKKKIIIAVVILIILVIFECKYLKKAQLRNFKFLS